MFVLDSFFYRRIRGRRDLTMESSEYLYVGHMNMEPAVRGMSLWENR